MWNIPIIAESSTGQCWLDCKLGAGRPVNLFSMQPAQCLASREGGGGRKRRDGGSKCSNIIYTINGMPNLCPRLCYILYMHYLTSYSYHIEPDINPTSQTRKVSLRKFGHKASRKG